MQRAGESAVIAGPWVKREELDLSGLAEEMRELGSRLSSLVYRGGDVSKFGRIHAGVDRGALNEVWLAGAALAGLLLSFQKAAAGELGMPEGATLSEKETNANLRSSIRLEKEAGAMTREEKTFMRTVATRAEGMENYLFDSVAQSPDLRARLSDDTADAVAALIALAEEASRAAGTIALFWTERMEAPRSRIEI